MHFTRAGDGASDSDGSKTKEIRNAELNETSQKNQKRAKTKTTDELMGEDMGKLGYNYVDQTPD